jgi:hypothetical protein
MDFQCRDDVSELKIDILGLKRVVSFLHAE